MESNSPQPGRIPPIQKGATKPSTGSIIQTGLNKIPESHKKDLNIGVGVAGAATANPLGIAALGGVYLNARAEKRNRSNMDKFRNDIERYGQAAIPKVKKRISTIGQVALISFGLLVDIVEAILDLFAIGIIANRIIDIVVAVVFFGYALFKGLTIADHAKVYGSIVGTLIGEMIPGLDIAPFFTLDAWYITHTLKHEAKVKQQEIDEEAAEIISEKKQRDFMENYARAQAETESEFE